MTHLLAIISIVLYIGATLLNFVQLWRAQSGGKVGVMARWAFIVAFVLHTATMGFVIQDPRLLLMDNGADYFLWVSWGLALVYLALERRLNYPLIGAFVIPAVVLFMGSSSYLLHKEGGSLIVQSAEKGEGVVLSLLHAVAALVSVVSLALALVVSVVFLIVERRLKRKKGTALAATGPNLQILDSLNKQLAQVGFGAISLVIVSGGLWAVSEQKPVFSSDTSVVSGIAVWMLLAFILNARLVLRWSAKQVSRLTVIVTAWFFVTVFVVMAFAGRFAHTSLAG